MQPLAPFGQFLAFSFTEDFADARSLPADRRLAAPEMERERAAIAELRAAVRLFDEGKIEESGRLFDALAARAEPSLHPLRLVWAQARVRWTLGKLEQADALLARLNTAETPFDVRAHGLVMRALIADRRGRRGDAVQLYQTAQALLDANAAYTDRNTGAPLRARIAAGLGSPQTKGDMPATPDLQGVPR